MNKLSLILAAVIALFTVGCTSDEPVHQPNSNERTVTTDQSNKITPKQAVEIANTAAATIDGATSRASLRFGNIAKSIAITRGTSRGASMDTIIYVVNYENERGYALVSAYNIESNIIAIIDKGHYPTAEEDTFEMFKYYVESAKLYIDSKREVAYSRGDFTPIDVDPWKPRKEFKTVKDTVYNTVVKAKLGDLEWGQGYPLSRYCPNKVVGCSPLAIAMTMAVFKPTQYITYTYPGAEVSGEYIDWNLIWQHKSTLNTNTQANLMLSRLCRQIGHKASSEYKPAEAGKGPRTSTSADNQKSAAKYFLNQHSIDGYHDYDVWNAIDAIESGLTIFIGKNYIDNVESGGHAWIGDGFWKYYIRYRYYERDANLIYIDDDSGWELTNENHVGNRYVHFNWGWDGAHNGYYLYEPFTIKRNDGKSEDYRGIQFLSIK